MNATPATALAVVAIAAAPRSDLRFVLLFQPLREDRPAVCVPCDEDGHVDLDSLEEPARLSYYFARTVIGRDFARPRVQAGVTLQ